MRDYNLPDGTAGVIGEVSPLATRHYQYGIHRSDIESSLRLALDELQKKSAKIEKLETSLNNAYDHIQHEAYNDALSSILEALAELQGE